MSEGKGEELNKQLACAEQSSNCDSVWNELEITKDYQNIVSVLCCMSALYFFLTQLFKLNFVLVVFPVFFSFCFFFRRKSIVARVYWRFGHPKQHPTQLQSGNTIRFEENKSKFVFYPILLLKLTGAKHYLLKQKMRSKLIHWSNNWIKKEENQPKATRRRDK